MILVLTNTSCLNHRLQAYTSLHNMDQELVAGDLQEARADSQVPADRLGPEVSQTRCDGIARSALLQGDFDKKVRHGLIFENHVESLLTQTPS